MKITSAKDLRVIIATPCFHVLDGVSLTVRKIRKEVESQGGKILILTSSGGKNTDSLSTAKDFENILYCESSPLPYDVSEDSYAICRSLNSDMKKKILEFGPTVIHITSPDTLCYSVSLFARKMKIPLMATWHSNIPDYLDHVGRLQVLIVKPILVYVFKTLYSYSSITFVPQESLKERMLRENYEIEHRKNELRVWGRGVDTEMFNPKKRDMKVRKEYNISEKQVIVLWVGRCVKEKRPQVWVYVLNKLAKNYPDKVRGVLVGRGDRYDVMSAPENVIPVGWKNRDDLAKLYATSDILLFPSGVETFGNVTLEGMSSGIPCVVNKSCSSHLVSEDVGFAIEPCKHLASKEEEHVEFEEYYKAVEKLVLDEKLRKKLGQNARDVAVKNWSAKVILNQMVENYIEVSNTPREAIPDLDFYLGDWIVYFLYNMMDYGGALLVKFLGSLTFVWQDADKKVLLFAAVAILAICSIFFSKF